jgi:hypothetical protein
VISPAKFHTDLNLKIDATRDSNKLRDVIHSFVFYFLAGSILLGPCCGSRKSIPQDLRTSPAWRDCASKQRHAHTDRALRAADSALPSYPEGRNRKGKISQTAKRGPFEFAIDRCVPRQPCGMIRGSRWNVTAPLLTSLYRREMQGRLRYRWPGHGAASCGVTPRDPLWNVGRCSFWHCSGSQLFVDLMTSLFFYDVGKLGVDNLRRRLVQSSQKALVPEPRFS